MLKFDILRTKKSVLPLFLNKVEKNLANQITEGINSVPFKETQLIQMKVSDKPVPRFLSKFFGMPEEYAYSEMNVVFTRAFFDGSKLRSKKYRFTDVFSREQLDEVASGKNIVKEKGSFLNKLVDKINKAIAE